MSPSWATRPTGDLRDAEPAHRHHPDGTRVTAVANPRPRSTALDERDLRARVDPLDPARVWEQSAQDAPVVHATVATVAIPSRWYTAARRGS